MEKRESSRKKTHSWEDLRVRARIGDQNLMFPVVDISIGGIGVLVSDGFSLLQEGRPVLIKTLEKKGRVIAANIQGRIAYLGTGVPSRVGIDFAPADTPIEAYARLSEVVPDPERIITDKEEVHAIFKAIQRRSHGFGDILMIHRQKAIPAEFFYLRPEFDNMVLRMVRISELKLPFQPQVGMTYPFYLFKGVNVMLFHATVVGVIKNIVETTWPETHQHVSRRSVLRYFITGEQPVTATIVHPITRDRSNVLVWDLSIEGMGAEVLDEKIPLIEGMNLPAIRIELPTGPVETAGVVRAVRREAVLDKTQLGIEFIGGADHYRDRILDYILRMDLPSETLTPAF